ncbi:MAG: RNA polymerase sigma factor [Granulosicoccaceae bacterium]
MSESTNTVIQRLPDELESLWRFAFRLCGCTHESKELVQQTCLRAIEQQHLYREKGSYRSWLFRILHNLWVNKLRSMDFQHQKQKSESQTDTDVVDLARFRSGEGSVSAPESVAFLHEVYRLMQSLPEGQRVVMELICVEGFSYKETAAILDIRIGTVMSRLARARMKIGLKIQPPKSNPSGIKSNTRCEN